MPVEPSVGLTIAFPKVLGISQLLAIILCLFAGYKVILDLQAKDREIIDLITSKDKYEVLIKELNDNEHKRLQKEIDKIAP